MTSVLVIEDEPETSDLLLEILGHLGYQATSARTGARGLELVAADRPDLVVLDLGLPDLHGLDVIRELRGWYEEPVLVVSGSSQVRRKVDALDAGADDFLDKPFDVAELRARLAAAERRSTGAAKDSALQRRFDGLVIDAARREVRLDGDEVRLTDMEWRLLEALSRHPGRLLTQRWVIGQLWDQRHGAEAQTSLRAHLRSLRGKLGDDASRPRYIRTESGIGYRWVAQRESAPSPEGGQEALDALKQARLQVRSWAPPPGVGAGRKERLVELLDEALSIVDEQPRSDGHRGIG